MKLPLKMVPLGTPYLPEPVTTKLEPVLEKVPPPERLPVARAPVEKLSEPRLCPGGAFHQLKPNPVSSDQVVAIPALVMVTEPDSLVKLTVFAHAAIGNSSVQRPSTTAIRSMVSSTELKRPFPTSWGAIAGVARVGEDFTLSSGRKPRVTSLSASMSARPQEADTVVSSAHRCSACPEFTAHK